LESLTNNFLGQTYASFVARGHRWRDVFGTAFALDILAAACWEPPGCFGTGSKDVVYVGSEP